MPKKTANPPVTPAVAPIPTHTQLAHQAMRRMLYTLEKDTTLLSDEVKDLAHTIIMLAGVYGHGS